MAKRSVSRMAKLAARIAAVEDNIQWQINACEKLMIKLEPLLKKHDEMKLQIKDLQKKSAEVAKLKLSNEMTVTKLLTDLHLVKNKLTEDQVKQVNDLTKRFTKQ